MKLAQFRLLPARGRTAALAAFMLLQSIATVFFLGDAVSDLVSEPASPPTVFEAFVAFILVTGLLLVGWQLRLTLERMRGQERALGAVRGHLGQIIETQFTEWGLTPAERDVGRLALKGLDLAEIADLRGAASGTVRAQLARIYAKAGVSGRHQFAAWFVEDLLHDGLSEMEPAWT